VAVVPAGAGEAGEARDETGESGVRPSLWRREVGVGRLQVGELPPSDRKVGRTRARSS